MINWKNVLTPEEEAAWEMAVRLKNPAGLTEWQVAEFICDAKHSLWYTQAKNWSRESDNQFLKDGAQALVELVDSGYNAQHRFWWHMETVWGRENISKKLASIGKMLLVTRTLRQRTSMVISTGFEIFAELILGKHWQSLSALAIVSPELFDKGVEGLFKRAEPIQPCVNPFCVTDNGQRATVDRTKKKSGACCKSCMGYGCTHPDCVAKAAAAGWARYTHRWGTKIANAHKEYRLREGEGDGD